MEPARDAARRGRVERAAEHERARVVEALRVEQDLRDRLAVRAAERADDAAQCHVLVRALTECHCTECGWILGSRAGSINDSFCYLMMTV